MKKVCNTAVNFTKLQLMYEGMAAKQALKATGWVDFKIVLGQPVIVKSISSLQLICGQLQGFSLGGGFFGFHFPPNFDFGKSKKKRVGTPRRQQYVVTYSPPKLHHVKGFHVTESSEKERFTVWLMVRGWCQNMHLNQSKFHAMHKFTKKLFSVWLIWEWEKGFSKSKSWEYMKEN